MPPLEILDGGGGVEAVLVAEGVRYAAESMSESSLIF
jgi:hypothetical protein